MAKGLFSQGICALTNGQTTIDDVKAAVSAGGFEVVKDMPPQALSGPAVLVAYRREVNGAVVIDLMDRRWPDEMGDSKTDPMTFGAWAMGFFGPFAYPGGLKRAIQHARSWKGAAEIAPRHRGVIRMRTTYIGGLPKDAPCLPKDYKPIDELVFLNRMVVAIAAAPGVLCYFNPGGEVIRDLESFHSTLDACTKEHKLPLFLWTNVRRFGLSDAFGMIDTVGNSQFDRRDVEAIYPIKQYDPNRVGYYVRNVTHYLLDLTREIQTGEAIDGPDENALSWIAEACDKGLTSPPRRVLRLYPKADSARIQNALMAAGLS